MYKIPHPQNVGNVGNVTKCYSLLPIPPECSNVGNGTECLSLSPTPLIVVM